MCEARLRIKIVADDRTGFTAMFEPLGMSYKLEPGSHLHAEVAQFRDGEKPAGDHPMGRWDLDLGAGRSHTYDADGVKLDELN